MPKSSSTSRAPSLAARRSVSIEACPRAAGPRSAPATAPSPGSPDVGRARSATVPPASPRLGAPGARTRFTLSPRSGAIVRQRATVRQACAGSLAPSSPISPHSSAIGMNSDGVRSCSITQVATVVVPSATRSGARRPRDVLGLETVDRLVGDRQQLARGRSRSARPQVVLHPRPRRRDRRRPQQPLASCELQPAAAALAWRGTWRPRRRRCSVPDAVSRRATATPTLALTRRRHRRLERLPGTRSSTRAAIRAACASSADPGSQSTTEGPPPKRAKLRVATGAATLAFAAPAAAAPVVDATSSASLSDLQAVEVDAQQRRPRHAPRRRSTGEPRRRAVLEPDAVRQPGQRVDGAGAQARAAEDVTDSAAHGPVGTQTA